MCDHVDVDVIFKIWLVSRPVNFLVLCGPPSRRGASSFSSPSGADRGLPHDGGALARGGLRDLPYTEEKGIRKKKAYPDYALLLSENETKRIEP